MKFTTFLVALVVTLAASVSAKTSLRPAKVGALLISSRMLQHGGYSLVSTRALQVMKCDDETVLDYN